jgi:hypothetical protein
MGLYLCVFDGDDELDGVDVGSYSDFDFFRATILDQIEEGRVGARFPTLMLHSDCDGEWDPPACVALENELLAISDAFRKADPIGFTADWQRSVAKILALKPTTLYDCFIDVDGEPLLERLIGLCRLANERGQPILFQ